MRIGFFADSPFTPTGYAKTAKNLTKELRIMGHQVSHCAFQHYGEPEPVNDIYEGYSVPSMIRYLETVRPEAVVHIGDIWQFAPKYNPNAYGDTIYKKCQELGIKFIIYSPIHSRPEPEATVKVAHEECDLYLTMSQWGRDTMILHGLNQSHADYIYHGVDTSIFHPMDKNECRKEFGFKENVPIVGSIAMNLDFRKNIPYTLLAFKQILEKFPDAELVLWTEELGHWDLPTWAHNLQIDKEKVHYANTNRTWGLPEDRMAKLVNCFDVYLNTATSEGFGLPILEALACRVPVVMTDTPVLSEIYSRYGLANVASLVESGRVLPTQWGAMEYLIDPLVAGNKVLGYIENPTEKITWENASRLIEGFSWRSAAQKLEGYIYDMLHYRWLVGAITDDNLGPATAHESFLIPEILDVNAEKPSAFLDIGAHVGHWSIRASRFYNRVIAVEPHPESMTVLMKNIELNDARNVEVRMVALTDRPRQLVEIHQFQNHHGGTSVYKERANDGSNGDLAQTLEVPATTLDNFVNNTGAIPTTIKIDVEGHEGPLLKGGLETLKANHPKLIVEVHNESDAYEIQEWLKLEAGYQTFKTIKDSLLPKIVYLIAR